MTRRTAPPASFAWGYPKGNASVAELWQAGSVLWAKAYGNGTWSIVHPTWTGAQGGGASYPVGASEEERLAAACEMVLKILGPDPTRKANDEPAIAAPKGAVTLHPPGGEAGAPQVPPYLAARLRFQADVHLLGTTEMPAVPEGAADRIGASVAVDLSRFGIAVVSLASRLSFEASTLPMADAADLARLLPGLAEDVRIAAAQLGPKRGGRLSRTIKLLVAERDALHAHGVAAGLARGEEERARLAAGLADLRAKVAADGEVSAYRENEIDRLTAERDASYLDGARDERAAAVGAVRAIDRGSPAWNDALNAAIDAVEDRPLPVERPTGST